MNSITIKVTGHSFQDPIITPFKPGANDDRIAMVITAALTFSPSPASVLCPPGHELVS
jgi:hypothetical protein